jgi:hypothetical protein
MVFCHGGVNGPLDSTVQIVLTAYFMADDVSCQCSNVGLQFILVEQIHNA